MKITKKEIAIREGVHVNTANYRLAKIKNSLHKKQVTFPEYFEARGYSVANVAYTYGAAAAEAYKRYLEYRK